MINIKFLNKLNLDYLNKLLDKHMGNCYDNNVKLYL